jgi:hypothetical protein
VKTIQQHSKEIVDNLRAICAAPEEKFSQLNTDLINALVRHNKQSLTQAELQAAKTELEAIVSKFRSSYQRFFVYDDPL